MHKFLCENLGLSVSFTNEAAKTLLAFRQHRYRNEAGGMLFCRDIDNDAICISHISTPGALDTKTRFFFKMDEQQAQKQISKLFKDGLHYIGDWHTHPQHSPRPSQQDIRTINDIFIKSQHNLKYFLIVIVSSGPDFSNSYVAFVDSSKVHKCLHIDPSLCS